MSADEQARPATPNAEDAMEGHVGPGRRKPPKERRGRTIKVEIESGSGGSFEGYLTANVDEDGTLLELFLHDWGKEGSTQVGLLQTIAMLFSIALQFGAELPMLVRKLAHMKFEPYGTTSDPEIPTCRSLPDYIAQRLTLWFGDEALREELADIRSRLETVR